MDFKLKGTVMGQKKTEKNRSVNKTEKQAVKERSRTVSGILAILLGALGIQKFYRGQWKQGILCLLFFWTGIPAVVGLLEGAAFLGSDAGESETVSEPAKQKPAVE